MCVLVDFLCKSHIHSLLERCKHENCNTSHERRFFLLAESGRRICPPRTTSPFCTSLQSSIYLTPMNIHHCWYPTINTCFCRKETFLHKASIVHAEWRQHRQHLNTLIYNTYHHRRKERTRRNKQKVTLHSTYTHEYIIHTLSDRQTGGQTYNP
jgi:hypothetical protein